MKRLGQQDLLRQMLRIEWAEPVQFLNHFRSDSLRLAILRPAMHDAMPGRSHCVMPAAFLDPQSIRMPTASVWSGAVTDREKLSAWFKPFTRKVASGSPIRSIALQNPSERVSGLEQRELDARRAAIDRQDAWVSPAQRIQRRVGHRVGAEFLQPTARLIPRQADLGGAC